MVTNKGLLMLKSIVSLQQTLWNLLWRGNYVSLESKGWFFG